MTIICNEKQTSHLEANITAQHKREDNNTNNKNNRQPNGNHPPTVRYSMNSDQVIYRYAYYSSLALSRYSQTRFRVARNKFQTRNEGRVSIFNMFNALKIKSSVNINESVRHGRHGDEFTARTDGQS